MVSPQGREDDQEKPWTTSPFPGLYLCLAQHCNVVSPEIKPKRTWRGTWCSHARSHPGDAAHATTAS